MATPDQRREAIETARLAAEAAAWKQRQVQEHGKIVESEAMRLRILLQENNLSRRLRRAMILKWGGGEAT